MAHEIENINGSDLFAYTGERPWHGLGKEVPGDLTPEQFMEAAGLDWSVEKRPLYMQNPDGGYIDADHFALVRDLDNKILDYVPGSWNPLQNAEAFGFFHSFVMNGEMSMETAGSLREGKLCFALAKMGSVYVGNDDEIARYMLFSNPHQYGKSVDVRMVTTRVVCNNTHTLAMGEVTDRFFRMSHASVFEPEAAKEALNLVDKVTDKFIDRLNRLAVDIESEENLMKYFDEIFPSTSKEMVHSRNAEKLREMYDLQPGADDMPDTWYKAYNAVTALTTHVFGRTQETRLDKSLYGAGMNIANKALEKALERV